MAFIVAIDGPAGTGKSTITKMVGKKLNLFNINTGSIYRCITLECLNKNININDIDKISDILKNIKIEIKSENDLEQVYLNNENVTKIIRQKDVDDNVAKFATLRVVREKATLIQREFAKENDVILEGRDIGTVVYPNADVKIFLDCSLEERANRRYKQNIENGNTDLTYEEILENIKQRNKLETERELAPLVQAEDAIYIDTTNLTIEEVLQKIIDIINAKRKNV